MAGPDLTVLTAAVDFGTVTTAILTASGVLAYVYVAWKGAHMVLQAVKGTPINSWSLDTARQDFAKFSDDDKAFYEVNSAEELFGKYGQRNGDGDYTTR